jgi:prenyl protein peptidase
MGVSASSLLSLAGTAYLILEHSRPVGVNTTEYASRLLGLALPEKALAGCFYPLALTATLFLGPLYTLFLDGALPGQANFTVEEDIKQRLGSFVGLRNYFLASLSVARDFD